MRYWPIAPMMDSPNLQDWQKSELTFLKSGRGRTSESTLQVCHTLALNTIACTSMLLIRSQDAPFRRVYVKHPTRENWLALERGGFVDTHDGFGFIMDALH